MPTVHPFFHLMGINSEEFSREEQMVLEAELFERVCDELKKILKEQNKDYFHLMRFNTEKENMMIEAIFIQRIINDILSTEEYNLSGIACYTYTPEDIIFEIATGRNTNPSLFLSTRIIELHRSVRPNLYREIMRKIIQRQAEAA